MKISIINQINLTPAIKQINDPQLWLFGAKEWQRILYDYIPHETNMLRQHVAYRPGEIEYKESHSRFIYYGIKMVNAKYKVGGFKSDGGITWFSRPGIKKVKTDIPLNLRNGSRLWDKKAISEKKDLILIKSMQGYIDRNL